MDVREKLVELLTDNLPRCGNLPRWDNPLQLSCDDQVQRIADHLIMNGVTVQECISVAERLPDKNDPITMAALWRMDGEPVWVVYDDGEGMWALVEVCEESIFLTNNLGGRTEYADDVELEDDGLTVYRQP